MSGNATPWIALVEADGEGCQLGFATVVAVADSEIAMRAAVVSTALMASWRVREISNIERVTKSELVGLAPETRDSVAATLRDGIPRFVEWHIYEE